MTLRAYLGELFLVPYPLELSLIEPCDMACRYCFAILGDRARHFSKSDVARTEAKAREVNGLQDTLNLIATAWNRKTLDAKLFQEGYPILISNRTDPFGRKNRQPTIALLELLQELNKPVAFQTKGFIKHDEDFDRVMNLIQPSTWYVSISFNDDEIRKRVEPGATAIEYRWELVKELKRRGHVVSVGWNPFCPEWFGWQKGADQMIEKMIDAKVDFTCMQPLHVNYHWIMTDREKEDMHGGDMAFWNNVAGKKSVPPHWGEIFEDCHLRVHEAGIGILGHWFGGAQDLWGSTHALYPKTYPTLADFNWHCSQTKKVGDLVTFSEWYKWVMSWGVPNDRLYPLGQAIGLKSWRLCSKIKAHFKWKAFKNNMSWRQFLAISWLYQDRLESFTPYAIPSFCPAYKNGEILTEDGLPVLAYAPSENPLHRRSFWEV